MKVTILGRSHAYREAKMSPTKVTSERTSSMQDWKSCSMTLRHCRSAADGKNA
jgi:hypothetical protein